MAAANMKSLVRSGRNLPCGLSSVTPVSRASLRRVQRLHAVSLGQYTEKWGAVAKLDEEKITELANRLLAAETQLADVFSPKPGKLMPKASDVVRLRSEVAELREQIDLAMGLVASPVSSGLASKTHEHARRIFARVEKELASQYMSPEDENREISRLQMENTRLRAQAQGLLARQSMLEVLLRGI